MATSPLHPLIGKRPCSPYVPTETPTIIKLTAVGSDLVICKLWGEFESNLDDTQCPYWVHVLLINNHLYSTQPSLLLSFLLQVDGPFVLQIAKIRNVSAPKDNEESQAAPPLFKVTLTDGHNSCIGIENEKIPNLG